MAIPSVVQGTVEADDGKVFELDSPKGAVWVESVSSFRFEPTGTSKPYTVRKEAGKGGYYWYGYRKQGGKLHKKYIGKSSELSAAKLEEIGSALNAPPQPQVTERVAGRVTEVTYTKKQAVTDKVTDRVTVEEFTALKSQVQELHETVKALREALPGKSEPGDSPELPSPGGQVTDNELQIELGNLKAENEKLQTDYAALLESSTAVTKKLEREVRELRSQIEAQKTSWDELREELENSEELRGEVQAELADREAELAEVRSQLETERADREELQKEFDELNKQYLAGVFAAEGVNEKPAAAKELPEAADLLNQLKAKRKKSPVTLADVEAILEMIEKSCDDTSQED